MSNGTPSLWNPTTRMMLITWAVVLIAVYVFFQFSDRQRTAMRNDLSQTQSSVSTLSQRLQQGDTAVATELSTMKSEVQRLTEQIATYERATGIQEEQLRRLHDTISEKESERAIARANAISLSADIAATRQQLEMLKKLQAAWQAKTASLMTGDPGRRIAASPAHWKLVRGVLAQEQPTAEQVQQWDRQLAELAAPIEQVLENERSVVALLPEHAPLLADLGQQVSEALSALQQQQLLVEAVLKETAETPPGERTLEEIQNESQVATAHTEAEEFLQRRERALQAEREKTEQAIIAAEREKERELRELKLAAIETNTQIEAQKLKDAIAEVEQEQAERRHERAKAERERQFEAEWPRMREFLTPFTSDGFMQPQGNGYARTATRGPVSFSKLEGSGKLEKTVAALQQLSPVRIGGDRNDRPLGGFPSYRPGIEGWTNEMQETTSRVQDFLIRYGEIMVEKGHLAP